MVKLRQDAWHKENDELLAEAVLRHVKEGSTQLNAFEEVGDALNRTAAACGFRWNAVVRKVYESDLREAKKERKDRMRAFGGTTRRRTTNTYILPNHPEQGTSNSIHLSSLTMDVVIAYLLRLQHAGGSDVETNKWRHIANVATEKVTQLENELTLLKQENNNIREDYEQFVQIMNRARRLVTLEEEQERTAPVFKMERNGNLIVSSSMPQEHSDAHS